MNKKLHNSNLKIEKYEEQTIELKKQIESMEAQIRADKEFIDVTKTNSKK